MTYFKDVVVSDITERRVYLDLDGTVVPDGLDFVDDDVATQLRSLSEGREVFVVSNNGGVRARRIADQYRLHYVATQYRKPDTRVISDIQQGEVSVVIGDKLLTDGIFAHRIGARFIQVEPIRGPKDSLFVRSTYMLDYIVSMALRITRRIVHSSFAGYVQLLRPTQWVKNALIFAPLFFAGGIFSESLILVALSFFAFSFAASAGYVVNDVQDRAHDLTHPVKRFRPVASGAVSMNGALLAAGLLVSVALYVGYLVPGLLLWVVAYLALSFIYSTMLKHVPVLEFVSVAVFYVIRVLAGGVAALVPVSGWIILTTFFAALLITVGKRYAEADRTNPRSVIAWYPPAFLVALPAIAAALTIVFYAMYTIVGTTNHSFVFSNVFVVFGVLWYVRSIYARDGVEHPERKLWGDFTLLSVLMLWGLYLGVVLYSGVI